MGVLITITTGLLECQILQHHHYGCVRHGEVLLLLLFIHNFYQSTNSAFMLIYMLFPYMRGWLLIVVNSDYHVESYISEWILHLVFIATIVMKTH